MNWLNSCAAVGAIAAAAFAGTSTAPIAARPSATRPATSAAASTQPTPIGLIQPEKLLRAITFKLMPDVENGWTSVQESAVNEAISKDWEGKRITLSYQVHTPHESGNDSWVLEGVAKTVSAAGGRLWFKADFTLSSKTRAADLLTIKDGDTLKIRGTIESISTAVLGDVAENGVSRDGVAVSLKDCVFGKAADEELKSASPPKTPMPARP